MVICLVPPERSTNESAQRRSYLSWRKSALIGLQPKPLIFAIQLHEPQPPTSSEQLPPWHRKRVRDWRLCCSSMSTACPRSVCATLGSTFRISRTSPVRQFFPPASCRSGADLSHRRKQLAVGGAHSRHSPTRGGAVHSVNASKSLSDATSEFRAVQLCFSLLNRRTSSPDFLSFAALPQSGHDEEHRYPRSRGKQTIQSAAARTAVLARPCRFGSPSRY